MLNSRYTFDTSSKKYICPNCGKKRFVRYIDLNTDTLLPSEYGKCDRLDNCNYLNAPKSAKIGYLVKFLTYKQITDKASKLTDTNGTIHIIPRSQILEIQEDSVYISDWYLNQKTIPILEGDFKNFSNDNEVIVNTKVEVKPTIKAPSYLSLKLLDEAYCNKPIVCNLEAFLLTKYTKEQVFKAKQNYFLTGTNTSWKNATIFWQIDENENIRSGKIMLYDKDNGKRIKTPYNHINWMHSALKLEDFNLSQCLYGLQRIREDYMMPICITESEKTAIVMSIEMPNKIWLATGSKANMKEELLKPIRQRDITIYPDKGEFNNWLEKANALNSKGFTIKTSNLIENKKVVKGYDLADMMLN